eukprot:1089436-Pyramimonas_sp.AAC.1
MNSGMLLKQQATECRNWWNSLRNGFEDSDVLNESNDPNSDGRRCAFAPALRWYDSKSTVENTRELAKVLNQSSCNLPVFWGFDQTVHTTINTLPGRVKHYLLMETPYYGARIPNTSPYSRTIRPSGYLSLGFNGLQGRAIQWKDMPPTR